MPQRTCDKIEEEITDSYKRGMSVQKISAFYQIHRSTVQRILKRKKVTLRLGSPQFQYNVSFFDKYNYSSCYWAGFIAADGCVRSGRDTLHIKLSITDLNHLEKFKKAIGYEGRVHPKGDYCFIDVSGKWFPRALFDRYAITRRKTERVIVPSIPDKYINSFLRGFFDGDGCISVSTCPYVSFTCCSKRFLEQIREIFFDRGIRLKSKNRVPPIQKGCQISYSGRNAGMILGWMYGNASENERLERKYHKFLTLWVSARGVKGGRL